MKWLAIGGLILLSLPTTAFAAIDQSRDWRIIDEEPLRELSVCYHRALHEEWRGWAQDAINEFNRHETGWTIDVVPFTKDRCEVFLITQDIQESLYEGYSIEFIDVLSGETEEIDGRHNGAILTVDLQLEETLSWIDENEDIHDTFNDGWSTTEGELTRDPIDALLGAFLKLAQVEQDSTYSSDEVDQDLADPKHPGEHYHELTDFDVKQLKKSATKELSLKTITTDYLGSENEELGDVVLDVPAYSTGFFYGDVEISYQDITKNPPSAFSLPEDYNHFNLAFGIFSNHKFFEPIQLTLKADESMVLVRYDKQSWDLTPVEVGLNPSEWQIVKGVDYNEDEEIITFSLDEMGYYGLVSQEPEEHSPYTQAIGDRVLSEEEIQKRAFIQDVKDSLFLQMPAFVTGFLAGGLIVWVWMTLARRSRKKRDSHSVTHVDGF